MNRLHGIGHVYRNARRLEPIFAHSTARSEGRAALPPSRSIWVTSPKHWTATASGIRLPALYMRVSRRAAHGDREFSSDSAECLEDMTSTAVQFVPVFPDSVKRDLRTDHAGEFGAVLIYKGALAAARLREKIGLDTEGGRVIEFAEHHMETEQKHLDIMLQLVPPSDRTTLLPLWRLMALSLGFFPTLLGPRQLYWTIAAVETFVEQHYLEQIEKLRRDRILPELCALLVKLKDEEVHHRDEAVVALFGRKDAPEAASPSGLARAWMVVVDTGSKAAVQASLFL